MQHCPANTCDTAYCKDMRSDSWLARTPFRAAGIKALVCAVEHLHRYRDLRGRLLSQSMRCFDCEDES